MGACAHALEVATPTLPSTTHPQVNDRLRSEIVDVEAAKGVQDGREGRGRVPKLGVRVVAHKRGREGGPIGAGRDRVANGHGHTPPVPRGGAVG